MVAVVWAKTAGALRSVQAAATDAAHAWRAASGGRTLSGTAGAPLFGPRVHLHGCGGDRGGGGRQLGRRSGGAEGVARVAQVHGQPADGSNDPVRRGPLGRALEGTLHQRLGGEGHRARRIDQRRHDRPADRVETLESWIGPLGGLERDESRREQQRQEPPTVTTELGAPYSSSRAAGAAGSASHLTPSTRNA